MAGAEEAAKPTHTCTADKNGIKGKFQEMSLECTQTIRKAVFIKPQITVIMPSPKRI